MKNIKNTEEQRSNDKRNTFTHQKEKTLAEQQKTINRAKEVLPPIIYRPRPPSPNA